jgi:hypothetical protein
MALFAVALERPAVAQTTIYNVDAFAGSDVPGSPLYKSIRFAVSDAPSSTTRIMVRGRFVAGQAVLHTDAIEGWLALGPIVLRDNLSVEWDSANSDLGSGGLPTPAVLTGSGISAGLGSTAFSFDQQAPVTQANASIKGIQIVAFDVGIDWRPANGALSSVGVTLDSVRFNQCIRGFHIEPGAATPVAPLVTACSFENTAQAPTIGGDRGTGLIALANHVDLIGDGTDDIRGEYTNCLFTSDAANAGGGAISVIAGISAQFSTGSSATFTVTNCDFQGNGSAIPHAANGMLIGIYFFANGRMPASTFLVQNSYFQDCGYAGAILLARGQAVVALNPDGSYLYDSNQPGYISPEIRSCTFLHNGYVATSLGAGVSKDIGHGVVARAYDFGLLLADVHDCDATGTSGSHPNLGITANALDGVYIHSDWWLPEVGNVYTAGVITFTQNSSRVGTSRVYTNLRHGVEILMQEAGGNAGVKGNRIYNNAGDGVHIEAIGALDWFVDPRERVWATPVAWNNFVYNVAGASPVQVNGIRARFTEDSVNHTLSNPNIVGIVGVLFNTSTNQSANGIEVRKITPFIASPPLTSVEDNIAFFNTGTDMVLLRVKNDYNCSSNLIGAHNITANPQLVSYLTGDLHLLGTSPCIDQDPVWPIGYSQTQDDIDLQTRPRGPTGRYDIGADEF